MSWRSPTRDDRKIRKNKNRKAGSVSGKTHTEKQNGYGNINRHKNRYKNRQNNHETEYRIQNEKQKRGEDIKKNDVTLPRKYLNTK